ncbi:hypothetical protein LEHPIFIF_00112 [Aeromonas phage avDM9-HANS]|nr:hypothetical protein LEHPIFIF_00112 [Aeromonas phage avDM9-HANS]
MAKQKKAVEKKVEAPKTGRHGYKRKSNARVDQAGDALVARVLRQVKHINMFGQPKHEGRKRQK